MTGSCTAAAEYIGFCQEDPPAQAIDGNPHTRYTSGSAQNGTEEFTVTFASPVTISGVGLTAPYAYDASAAYAVESSLDGSSFVALTEGIGPAWGPGFGEPSQLDIAFAPTRMRVLKVKQTGEKPGWWSISELTVADCEAD